MSVLLFLHILGAFLFLGNIATAAFWKGRADASGNPAVIHFASKNVMIADYAFTLPGLALLTVSGILMAIHSGALQSGFNWLALSLILFAATGLIWLGLLIPLQRKLIRHSKEAVDTGVVPAAYRKATSQWNAYGIVATLMPLVILYLMISRSF